MGQESLSAIGPVLSHPAVLRVCVIVQGARVKLSGGGRECLTSPSPTWSSTSSSPTSAPSGRTNEMLLLFRGSQKKRLLQFTVAPNLPTRSANFARGKETRRDALLTGFLPQTARPRLYLDLATFGGSLEVTICNLARQHAPLAVSRHLCVYLSHFLLLVWKLRP